MPLVDVQNDLELYFGLNENERRIVQMAVRIGDTPLACAIVEVYFPELTPERLQSLKEEITALKD